MPEPRQVDGAPGELLLLALFSTVRRLRAQGHGEPIDLPSMYVLNVVREHPGIRVSELAGNVGLDASTVSRHIRSLELVGYLSRLPDPRDRRASCLQLTPDGLTVIAAAFDTRAAMIREAMSAWSVEDRSRFTELAVRFADDFDKVASALAPGPHH